MYLGKRENDWEWWVGIVLPLFIFYSKKKIVCLSVPPFCAEKEAEDWLYQDRMRGKGLCALGSSAAAAEACIVGTNNSTRARQYQLHRGMHPVYSMVCRVSYRWSSSLLTFR